MMRLKKLLQQIQEVNVKGSKEIEITGLCANSKFVAPGNLFIAKKGMTHDGARFIPDAIEAGAVAVLTDMYDPFLPIVQLIHPDVRKIEAKLAAAFYYYPSSRLKVIGVTGTNGKTTTSYLIRHLLQKNGISTGLTGSVEWIIGDHHFPVPGIMTTPDVITNHKLLREMVNSDSKAAVMEVTSHGLDQSRVEEIHFEIALFTNLHEEHLDYHQSFAQYREAKGKLFSNLGKESWAIFNADDPHDFETRAKRFYYGIENDADLLASNLKFSEKGTECILSYRGEKASCKTPLIGRFNVYNLLGALSVGLCLNLSLDQCISSIKNFKKIPGRLERVKNRLGLNIFVDYAHSEDALRRVLESLSAFKKGKIVTVFGCGGDRDRKKREKMGKVVNTFSDHAIITNDNPRSEDPEGIAAEIYKGFSKGFPVMIELDRKKAIKKAIDQISPNDILLIAGKGHEKEQIFAHQISNFDDVLVAQKICEEKEVLDSVTGDLLSKNRKR